MSASDYLKSAYAGIIYTIMFGIATPLHAQITRDTVPSLRDSIRTLERVLNDIKTRRDAGSGETGKTSPFITWLKKWEVRQTFSSASGSKEPAKLQLTLPRHGSNSFLFDGAVAAPVPEVSALKLVGEYHRNTALEKQQYNWQVGISHFLSLKLKNYVKSNAKWRAYVTSNAKFSRNIIDSVSSLLLTTDASLFRTGTKGLNLGTYTYTGKIVHLAIVDIAPEYQSNFVSKKSSLKGDILRPVLKLQYSFGYNKAGSQLISGPEKSWEFSASYTARYDVINSTDVREYYTDLLKLGFDYYILSKPVALTIGISYNRGSDPSQGLKQQDFWLCGFTIKK